MKHLILILFLITIINLSAQEWTNISPFPTSNIGILGSFISSEKGWIFQGSSDSAKDIYYTEDGGENWVIIYTLENPIEFFTSINMVDSLHGWATKMWVDDQNADNQMKYYLKTTDGGYSWDDMTDYMPDLNDIYPLYFINQDIGFLCGGCDSLSGVALIYKTIDSGYNWYLTETPMAYLPYPNFVCYVVNKFFFLDENNGWTACSVLFDFGLSLSTSDGGESWEIGIYPGPPDVYDIHFVNPDYGGAIGRNAFYSFVYITENNFQTILYSYQGWVSGMGQFAQALCFQNDSTIWVTGNPGIIYRSENGGATFEVFQVIDADLQTIQFFDNTGYIFGNNQNALLRYVEPVGIGNDVDIKIQDLNMIAYPNPFNPSTTISFETTNLHENTRIEIYNLRGQKVKTLSVTLSGDEGGIGVEEEAKYSVTWNGKDQNNQPVASGIYFYKLKSGDIEISRKMLLLK